MSKLTCLAAIIKDLRGSHTVALLTVLFSSLAIGDNPPPIISMGHQNKHLNSEFWLPPKNLDVKSKEQFTEEWLSRYWSLGVLKSNNDPPSSQTPKRSAFVISNQS